MTTQQRILVADDDPEIRKLLARYIEGQGFSVLLAASCHELHERLRHYNESVRAARRSPTLEEVQTWVAQADSLPILVT